jgi:hypothetical protein
MKNVRNQHLILALLPAFAVTLLNLQTVQALTALSAQTVSIAHAAGVMSVSDFGSQPNIFKPSADMNCAEILEIPGAFLCETHYQFRMNKTFTKIGFFWGTARGFNAGTLIENQNPLLAYYSPLIDGQNLPGNVIADYFKAAQALNDPKRSLNSFEKEFFSGFVMNPEIVARNNSYYVIAISNETKKKGSILSHELNHARYSLSALRKQIIDEFWQKDVSAPDKIRIRRILGRIYNAHNESTMIDEFQAYLLQDDAGSDLMADFLTKYRRNLSEKLKRKGTYK